MRIGEQDNLRIMLKKMLIVVLIIFGISAVIVVGISLFATFGGGNKIKIDVANATITQIDTPKDDQEVAVIKTNYGEMKIALFREYAPNTVENFVSKAKAGYYNGTHVFENEPGIYFIGGSKNKDGTCGEKAKIDNEISAHMWPLKGSICSIGENRSNVGGNNLLFVNSIEFTDEIVNELNSLDKDSPLVKTFIEKGGIPNFVGQYTVFAQTYEGLDVFEKISNLASDTKTKRPIDDIVIESVTISTYAEAKNQ